MYWNHRVVKTTEHGETLFSVQEVHYNDDDTLMTYTEPFLHDETIEGLAQVHARMTAALALPVLNAEDFPRYDDDKPEALPVDVADLVAAGVVSINPIVPVNVEEAVRLDAYMAALRDRAAGGDHIAATVLLAMEPRR